MENVEQNEFPEFTVDDDTQFVDEGNGRPYVNPKEEAQPEEPAEEKEEPKKRGRKPKESQEPPKEKVSFDENGNMTIEEEIEIPDEEPKQTDVEQPSNGDRYFNNVYDTFKEIGVITRHEGLEDGQILDNESLIDIVKKEQEAAAQEMAQNYLSRFQSPEAQKFLEFVGKGGSIHDFFETYRKIDEMGLDGDINDSKFQENIIRNYLSKNGYSSEEVNEQIEMLTDSGKREKYARKYLDQMQQAAEAERQRLVEEREQEERAKKEMFVRSQQNFVQALESTNDVFGSKLTKEKKETLFQVMFQPMKRKDGVVTTMFNEKLNMVYSDPVKLVILADLLMNNLDFGKYTKAAETKAVQQLRAGLDKAPKQNKKSSPFDKLFT